MTQAEESDLVERLNARAPYYEEWARDIRALNGTSVDADHADSTARELREAAAEIARLRAENAFLHERRGQLVIERDRAQELLMEWTKSDGPNQKLLEDAGNSALKAAIAEHALTVSRAAIKALVGAAEPFIFTEVVGNDDGVCPLAATAGELRALSRAVEDARRGNDIAKTIAGDH